MEKKAACGVLLVRVERLAGSDESDAEAAECGQLLIQVEHGAPEAINLVDDDAIELVLGGVGHEPIQCGAVCLAAAKSGIHVFPGDLPPTPGDVFPQLTKLHLAVLIGSADSGVKGTTHVIIVQDFRTEVNRAFAHISRIPLTTSEH